MQVVWTQKDAPPLCDKCLERKMELVQLSDCVIYKCPTCTRAYDAFDGYYDLVAGEARPDQSISQFRCPKHNHPMCVAAFQLNRTESVRIWGCPLAGCKEEKITIGENYAAENT